MNRSTSIFIGLLLIFLTSWLVLVVAPYVQLGRLNPDVDDVTQDQTPAAYSGLAEQGRQVYAANGCVYCHSQQVDASSFNTDIARKWGERRTVARDYLRDRAAYLGNSRLGPDLANFGARPEAEKMKDTADWLYAHFYAPDTVAEGTNCPPLPFLFNHREVIGQPSTEAVHLPGDTVEAVPKEEIVPGHDAKALAAYLLSLKRTTYKLAEAPEEKTDAP